ncbi:TerB family tellurite resistance protein, partial [Gammaproteobacteria bacterium]|nr:TerB family tellurite resistance protein [Gammaproteobacteria bacterium]
NIGADAFRYLSNAENLGSFTTALSTGVGVASLTYFGWMASIGTLGQLGLLVGVISTPAGWFAAAGAGCAATVLLTRRIFQSVKKEAVTEVPNFINSPLDILGSSICTFMCPILLKIAYADGHISKPEHEKIKDYFIDQWGINPTYVAALLKCDEATLRDFDWCGLNTALKEIEKTGDLKYSAMASEIISIATEVVTCDGESHPHELIELKVLIKELGNETFFTSVRNRLKRESN